MAYSALDSRDYRYHPSHHFHPLQRRHGYNHAEARVLDRARLIQADFQPGDQARYEFGLSTSVQLTIQWVDPQHISASDTKGNHYRFGGVHAPCPGKWDGDPVTITSRLVKLAVQS